MSDKANTIHSAVLAVMREVHAVGKNDVNAAQKFKFRGVDAVVNALAPAMRKHGLFIVPSIQDVQYSTRTSTSGSELQICRLAVSFTMFDENATGSITGEVAAEAFDSGDKATAKAMSVALRTFLLQAFMLPTDDKDPDADTYETRPALDKDLAAILKEKADVFASRLPNQDSLEALNSLFDEAVKAGVSETLKPAFTARKAELEAKKK